MGLSNYLPSSRLIQPGVCTSSTRPASPFEGQVIYETDTNKTYVYNGSAWVMLTNADTPPGLELVKTQTVGSGVVSVTVNNVFSSGYDNYRLEFSNPIASAGGLFYYLQFGSTTTAYYGSCFYDSFNGGSTGTARRNNSSAPEFCVSAATTGETFASIDIANPNLAKVTMFHGTYFGGGWTGWCGGQQYSTTQYTDFTINIQSPGTFSGGTIRVYGYRNSI